MTYVEYATRDGNVKQLDISAESTHPFGFTFQDRVSTPKGVATVLGVYEGKLYFLIDGESSASCWSSCRSEADFKAKGFRPLPQEVPSTEPTHRTKVVRVAGSDRTILMQGSNGPCPLLAAVNALSLAGAAPAALHDKRFLTRDELCDALAGVIQQAPQAPRIGGPAQIGSTRTLRGLVEGPADWRQPLSLDMVKRLYSGANVSPFFCHCEAFEPELDASLFAALGLRLFHTWIIEADGPRRAIRECSYNQITVESTDPNAPHADDARRFLNEASAQITEAGVAQLTDALADGEVGVLFRNNHFSTVIRFQDQLLTLITDEGYADKAAIVFEPVRIKGDSVLLDGSGAEIPPIVAECLLKYGDAYPAADVMDMWLQLDRPDIATVVEAIDARNKIQRAEAAAAAAASSAAMPAQRPTGPSPPAPQSPPVAPAVAATTSVPTPADSAANIRQQLLEMGFPTAKCDAVMATHPTSVESAVAACLS